MSDLFYKRLPLIKDGRARGGHHPYFVVWEITLRCDQFCQFCGTRAGHAREGELTTEEALDVVQQLAEMGTQEVALHGGEAYLRNDWLTIVAAIRDRGMDCTMVTGGRGFNRSMCEEAKAAGITAVSVSIDGTEATHDALRGLRGSHAGAMQAMRSLHDVGVVVGCNTQLNRENYRQLPDILDLFGEVPIYGWQVQLMVPMGRAADAEDLWLQPYDILEVIPRIAAARELCDERGIKLWPGNNVGYFGPFEHVLRSKRAQLGHASGCSGGLSTLGIEAHGDIKGCSAMASEGCVGGNVRDAPLTQIWQSAPELRFTRDFEVDHLWGRCRSCYYAEICKGGCIWTASTLMGRRGNNPYCHHRALELLAEGKRERLARKSPAAGLIRDTASFELTEEPAPSEWVAKLPKLPGDAAASGPQSPR